MPEYKKKKVKHRAYKAPVTAKQTRSANIPMKSKEASSKSALSHKREKSSSLKVVQGRKKERLAKWTVSLCGIVCILLVYLILFIAHPTGVLEYFTNLYASIGSGAGYDLSLDSNEIISSVSKGHTYFVLSDTSLTCVNNSGKSVLSLQHGFASPVLKVGDTRFLLYGQGQTNLRVYDLTKELYAFHSDHPILCADIARNGSVAVATKAEGYESKVTVTDKKEKTVYEWYSSDETIYSVCLTGSGKRLAVATLKVVDGNFLSKIYLLSFRSADPIKVFEYSGETVYELARGSGNTLTAVFGDRIEFINTAKGTKTEHSSEYSVNACKRCGNTLITVNSLPANKEESFIRIFSLKGKEISSFKINCSVSDVSYKNDRVCLLSDSQILVTDKAGKLIARSTCGFETSQLVLLSKKAVAGISSTGIQKYILEEIKE